MKKIGIICALDDEAELLIASLSSAKKEEKGSLLFVSGTYFDKEVIVARCGVGKVFAAMCAEAMILLYRPDAIINSGVAGSLSETLGVGDLCISADLVQHDFDTTAFGDPKGYIGGGIDRVFLPADENLKNGLFAAAEEIGVKAVSGRVASGDVFVASRAAKRALGKEFQADVCEMEGASMAQVAAANGVPFCAVRSVSDSLTDDSAVEFSAFVKQAAEVSSRLILWYLKTK